MNRIINIHTAQGRRLQNVIIRNKINLIDPILLMCPCRINRMRFIHLQMLSQIYIISITNRIGRISDIILIKFIIAIPKQLIRDTLPVRIQYIHIQIHSFLQQASGRILFEKRGYFRIINIIFDRLNNVGFAGRYIIIQLNLFLFYFSRTLHGCRHISHIVHSLSDFFFRAFRFVLAIYYRSIPYPS